MQYSPDAFDSFIKQKLDEVEVDPSMADDYWSKMDKDLTGDKEGLSTRNKFFYLCVCLQVLSSIFYLTYNEPAVAPIKDKAIKQAPAVIENKEVLSSKPSDVQPITKPHIVANRSGNNRDKVGLNKTIVSKPGNKSIDNTRAISKLQVTEQINPPKADISVSTNNKTIVQAPPVIAKDSIGTKELNPVKQKKKKSAVSIIW